MVVQGHVAHERLLQIFGAVEAVGLQDIGNAPVEAFDHAIGSGGPGLGQPVLYAQLLALKLPLEMGVLSFVQNVDKELRNGGKASTCGIHAGI